MTTIEITAATKVSMLKHLIAGKDLDLVADLTRIPRDTVLDIVSKHGYPNHDRMGWAIDMLIAGGNSIAERPADNGSRVLLDEPAPAALMHAQSAERRNSLAITPPAPTGRPVHTSTAELLHQAGESDLARTRALGGKISALLSDLTLRITDEQEAHEAKVAAEKTAAAVTARIATLQAEIDKLKRKPAKPATARAATAVQRSDRLTKGVHPCTTAGCDRTFDTPRGAVTHRRRAHEGFNPHATSVAS